MIELLVVIAIIGILSALILTAVSRVKVRAIRTKCLSNVKQFELALLSYAHDNRDRLPRTASIHPQGIDRSIAIELARNYLTPDVLCDPGLRLGGPGEFRRVWERNLSADRSPQLGYVTTLPRTLDLAVTPWIRGYFDSLNATIVPAPVVAGSAVVALVPSKRMLVAGVVFALNSNFVQTIPTDPAKRYTFNYTYGDDYFAKRPNLPTAEKTPGTDVYDFNTFFEIIMQTAHLDAKRKFPIGDNLGMLDGSAYWRRFQDMKPGYEGGFCWWW